MSQFSKLRREEGQGLVEYALILVLVAIVVIFILTILGNQVGLVFLRVNAALNGQLIMGEGTEYIIGNFSASAPGGGLSCDVTVSSFDVTVLQDGKLAGSNTPVSVTMAVSGAASQTLTGSTNASGVATINGASFAGGNCSGTATASGQGSSRSVSY